MVHTALARDGEELRAPLRMAVVVAAALVADVDLMFRFVDGRNHHNNETHSLGAALLAGVVALLIARLAGATRPLPLALAVGAAWGSHVLLDYLNLDTNPPIGIMAWWPWSDRYYKFPWPLFLDIGRTLEWETVRKNAVAGAWEAATLGPLAWVAWRRRVKG